MRRWLHIVGLFLFSLGEISRQGCIRYRYASRPTSQLLFKPTGHVGTVFGCFGKMKPRYFFSTPFWRKLKGQVCAEKHRFLYYEKAFWTPGEGGSGSGLGRGCNSSSELKTRARNWSFSREVSRDQNPTPPQGVWIYRQALVHRKGNTK